MPPWYERSEPACRYRRLLSTAFLVKYHCLLQILTQESVLTDYGRPASYFVPATICLCGAGPSSHSGMDSLLRESVSERRCPTLSMCARAVG